MFVLINNKYHFVYYRFVYYYILSFVILYNVYLITCLCWLITNIILYDVSQILNGLY